MKQHSKITIITFVHCSKENNRLPLLKECLNSIQMQKYPNYEHILVDDGSTINIGKLAKKYPNIKYIRKQKLGIINSTKIFNTGLKVASGKYVMYIASDDVQLPNSMKTLSDYLDKNKDIVGVIGSSIYQTIKKNKIVSNYKYEPVGILDKDALVKGNSINGCSIMFRRSVLDKIRFPENKAGMAADYDLWLKISEIGPIHMIKFPVVKYRKFENATRNVTKNTRKKENSIKFVRNNALIRRGLL